MTHSLFLSPFIEELVRLGKGNEASLRKRYLDVALRAAYRVLGVETPISASLSPQHGDVLFHQELELVDHVVDRRRQITFADASRIRAGKATGARLAVPIAYTRQNYDEPQTWQAEFGHLVPLPVYCEPLWEALTVDLNRELLVDFPAPEYAANTVGALLTSGGDWASGVSATHGPVTLTVEKAFWDFVRTFPTRGRVDYGFVVRVEGADPEKTKYCGMGGAWRLSRGDTDGIFSALAQLPTDHTSCASFSDELKALAEEVSQVGTDGLSEVTAAERLLAATLKRPGEDSFFRWTEKHLAELLEGQEWVLGHSQIGTSVRFRIVRAFEPVWGLKGFGGSSVRIRYEHSDPDGAIVQVDPGEVDYHNEDVLGLGDATPWSVENGPGSTDEDDDLRQLAAHFLEWLPVHLQHHLDSRGTALGMSYLYSFDGYFPLVELMEARLRHGRPGTPPVPPLSDQAAERAAALLTIPNAEKAQHAILSLDRKPVMVLEAGGFLLALADDVSSRPFSNAWIGLLPPGEERWCEILRVDVWNPPTRAVVDGDAFAFRRFVEWLREGVLRSGLDSVLTFCPDDDGPVELPLSAWLRFGVPYHGDRFLVDWRHQWDIVLSGVTIAGGLGGIYGMSSEQIARLEQHDRPAWRRFLREVIDPRFA